MLTASVHLRPSLGRPTFALCSILNVQQHRVCLFFWRISWLIYLCLFKFLIEQYLYLLYDLFSCSSWAAHGGKQNPIASPNWPSNWRKMWKVRIFTIFCPCDQYTILFLWSSNGKSVYLNVQYILCWARKSSETLCFFLSMGIVLVSMPLAN